MARARLDYSLLLFQARCVALRYSISRPDFAALVNCSAISYFHILDSTLRVTREGECTLPHDENEGKDRKWKVEIGNEKKQNSSFDLPSMLHVLRVKTTYAAKVYVDRSTNE